MSDRKYALDADERGDRIPRRGKNSIPPNVIPQPRGSGLATWRKRQAEEKRERMAALAELRQEATVEVREGREFRVVRIPDRYWWGDAA